MDCPNQRELTWIELACYTWGHLQALIKRTIPEGDLRGHSNYAKAFSELLTVPESSAG